MKDGRLLNQSLVSIKGSFYKREFCLLPDCFEIIAVFHIFINPWPAKMSILKQFIIFVKTQCVYVQIYMYMYFYMMNNIMEEPWPLSTHR